jgi:hypothetical protein
MVDGGHLLFAVSGLAKVAIFTIPMAIGIDVDNQILNYHKFVRGGLNRHFCQPRGSSSGSLWFKV